MQWVYEQPVEIVFETGGLARLGELCAQRGYRRGVLVCAPHVVRSGRAAAVKAQSAGRIGAIFSDITPNPRVGEADACAALMRETGADFAVAIGGGSAIDCAKAACGVACGDLPAAAYHTGGAPLPGRAIPLIAVPTTAGSGSEVTSVAILTDPERGVKGPIGGRSLFPKVALIDPALTCSVPPAVTASTGLDTLAHALEGFWSRNHQPICDVLARRAAGLVFDYLPRAFERGDDLEARAHLCEASVLAGLAFALPRTAAAHAISYPLTNVYGIPHGEACAFTLGALCVVNGAAEGGRLDAFARDLGFGDAAAMGARIDEMKVKLGMRTTLAALEIGLEDLPELVRLSRHPILENNPVALDDEALLALFQRLR